MFPKQIEALTAIDSLKTSYFSYASALKVLAELEPLVDAGLVPELIRARQGYPHGRSSDWYKRALGVAIKTARSETAGGLSFLASICVIALCSFLEDAIKEVVAREIVQHPEKWESHKSPQNDATPKPGAENDALYVARIFVDKRYKRKSNTRENAFQKLLSLLTQIGWGGGDLTTELSLTLHEMYEIRNAIVHSGARVDERLKREVVRFASSELGSPLSLDEKQFKKYLSAAEELVNTVISNRFGFNVNE